MKRSLANKTNKASKQMRLTNFFVNPQTSGSYCENKPAEESSQLETGKNDLYAKESMLSKPSSSQSSQKNQRKFKEDWCKEMRWIKFDQAQGIAMCEVCASLPNIADRNSKLVKGFSGPFKLETFKKHEKSHQHNRCVAANEAQIAPESTPLAMCIKKMDQEMFAHMSLLFNVAYYIAKNNKPFSDFAGLLELNSKLGIEVKPEYNNDKRCKEFITFIAKNIRSEICSELRNADFVSLLLDASTDKSGTEELILYIRYIKEKDLKEVLLTVVPLENTTADGYLESIKEELTKLGLSNWFSSNSTQLIGIGTDGAASMTGIDNGLVQKIRNDLSYIIGIHCVAHRLNLSVLSTLKNLKYIEDLDAVLKLLYKFYQHSPKRMRELKRVAEGLETKIQKFQYLHNVRWVASKTGALSALVKDWKCVITHLETLVAQKDSAAAMPKGLIKKLTDYKFVHMLNFILDFLKQIKSLSLLFQREELFLSTIQLHTKSTINSLKSLIDVPGNHESQFLSSTSVDGIYQDIELHGFNLISSASIKAEKEKIIQHAVQYLEERFLCHQGAIEKITSVFDTFSWPEGSKLENYGTEDIKMLAEHFQKQLHAKRIEMDYLPALQNEWYEFKVLGKGKKMSELLKLTLTNENRFPILGILLSIVSVLPVSTVCCERGFSIMNLIKNKFRSSMESESLNDLMISMNGPTLKDFNPLIAVDQWYFDSKTTRHVHGHRKPNQK